MANPRYAPEFKIHISGNPIPRELRASISGVRLTSGFDGADRLELTLANEGLRWLDHPLLKLDTNITLWIGYAPDTLTQLFVGEIVGKNATFPSGGGPTLTVSSQDRRRRLQQGNKVRWFAVKIPSFGNLALPDIATTGIVSLENGLIPIFDPVGAALSILLGGAEVITAIGDPDDMQKIIRKQVDESDFAFLKRIAVENGWDMFVDHSGALGGYQLKFMSPLSHLSADVVLKYGQSLVEFTPRLTTVGQLASISAYIWVAPIKTTFTVTVGWDWDRMSLSITISPALIPLGKGGSDYLIEEPVTPFSAPRKIIGELIPKLNNRLTGSGSTIGDPRIVPGAVLRLEGLGEEFGGLFRVTSATHSLDSGGYRTSFEVRKEIWFGSIPLSEQGALPIQINAPIGN
jgi:phage protein D